MTRTRSVVYFGAIGLSALTVAGCGGSDDSNDRDHDAAARVDGSADAGTSPVATMCGFSVCASARVFATGTGGAHISWRASNGGATECFGTGGPTIVGGPGDPCGSSSGCALMACSCPAGTEACYDSIEVRVCLAGTCASNDDACRLAFEKFPEAFAPLCAQ